LKQACIDESSAYGELSREDILSKWLENCAASQFVISDRTPAQADSVLEV